MDKAEMTFKISPDILHCLICVLLSSVVLGEKTHTLLIQCFSLVNSRDESLECFCVLQFYLNSSVFYLIPTRVLMT